MPQLYVRRRWWLAWIRIAGLAILMISVGLAAITNPGEWHLGIRVIAVLVAYGFFVTVGVEEIPIFWAQFDAEGVWLPTLRGWKVLRWREIVRVYAFDPKRIDLFSSSDFVILETIAFPHLDELLNVLRVMLPPDVARQLDWQLERRP